MKRLATIVWQSPAPTSVDERLAVYDDGTVWLVIRRPRELAGSIGSWFTRPAAVDLAALAAPGPAPIVFDVLRQHDSGAPASDELWSVAERVRAAAAEDPRAVATFGAAALEVVGPGRRSVALTVTGAGTDAVAFELDAARCTVQFSASGQAMAWVPLPELGSGFVTPDFEPLGGLRMRATVPPEAFGATAFEMAVPGGATTIAIQVAGWLIGALPDEPERGAFFTRTDEAPISA